MATQIDTEKVIEALTVAFTKVFSLRDLNENRNRCFGTLANFVSPKTGAKVVDVITTDDVGEVLNRIKNRHLARTIGEVDGF